MRELNLSEIRAIQIGLLRKLDVFCQEHGISYFLCNGTLLGAVKYSGYIPWDDDIDVCLLREDYEKLLRLYNRTNTDPRYRLYSIYDGTDYFFPFAKLSDEQTLIKESGVNNGAEFGLNIDIFPLDNYGNNAAELEKTFAHFHRLRRKLNLAKLNDFQAVNPIKAFLKRLLSMPFRLIGPQAYCKQIDRQARSLTRPTQYVGNAVWGFYGTGEAQKQAVFAQTVYVDFEGEKYPAPAGYDTYLRGLYGDYTQTPPLEKQVTHHRYQAFEK